MNAQEYDNFERERAKWIEREVALRTEIGILKYKLELSEAARANTVPVGPAAPLEPWRGVANVTDDVELTPLGRLTSTELRAPIVPSGPLGARGMGHE